MPSQLGNTQSKSKLENGGLYDINSRYWCTEAGLTTKYGTKKFALLPGSTAHLMSDSHS